jgi:metal-sulfur cluster biosynthetic enzyme
MRLCGRSWARLGASASAATDPTRRVCYVHAMSDAAPPADHQEMADQVREALKVVRDPEIPINVVDLGLIYNVDVSDDGVVDIDMTLTSMGCPVQDMIQADAELAAMKVEGVRRVNVEFVWSPPWSTDKMSDDGKKQMRMMGFNV